MNKSDTPTGPEVIADYVKRLSDSPGVYRMLDVDGEVLYVGKARKLKARVSSYAKQGGHNNRIARMISQTASMEFVTTRTEAEALLLEANLIKRFRPRYNVLLRDDKSFPYILLTGDHPAPMLTKHRGARTIKGDYYGPFASAGSVNRTINALQRAFLLRTCTDSVYESRTRPCLLYQIKRCSAPCTGEISLENYQGLVKEASQFLSGRSRHIRDELSKAMQQTSDALEFETAARYRDRLSALSHIQSHQGINPQGIEEADVFALVCEGGQSCIQVFFFRMGQNWGNRAYYPRADKDDTPPSILSAFLTQFYDNKPLPGLILLSHALPEPDLLKTAFSEKAGRNVDVHVPQRGAKYDLVQHALKNAEDALKRQRAEKASQKQLLDGFARVFDLAEPPSRIEIYDNSHIMGAHAVGAMVVAGPEGLIKNQYRKFNIRFEETKAGDDFGMMREVMTRRFTRLLKEQGQGKSKDCDEGEGAPVWPDVLLIDGGKGQISAVLSILDELGVDTGPQGLAVIGVAKGPDRNAGREVFYRKGQEPLMLPLNDPVLFFIQRLRDEAHRFAISTHRAKRSKAIHANPLDDIEGIGPTRKKALMNAFGSVKFIKRAALADLKAVPGISDALAQTIYDRFHGEG
jgi:excinuclease ABC subunit C